MKLLLAFLTTVLLSQFSNATGAPGDDPNLEISTEGAGSTFIGATPESKFCKDCQEKSGARLSNNVGVLNTTSGSAIGSGTSGKPVTTGQ